MQQPTQQDVLNAAKDLTYETYEIKNIRESDDVNEDGYPSYDISTTSGTGFLLDGKHGVIPKVGDTVRMWLMQLSVIRGVQINDQLCFYRTEKQERKKRSADNAESERKKKEEWAQDKDGRKTAYQTSLSDLPTVFQDRIYKFQHTNKDFDREYGNYEMSCCTDAVKIAEWAKQFPDPVKAVENFEWDSELIKSLGLFDGHSGNSFGFAKRLAYHYLSDPSLVVLEHGALTPLVGCENYGCPHPYEYVAESTDVARV